MRVTALSRVLGTVAGVVSVGFGLWHLFVPMIWDWYPHISPDAPELVIAVRAINFFFSLSLILFGGLTVLYTWAPRPGPFFTRALWAAMSVLWGARVAMQVIAPQGSASALLQYSMLTIFVLVFALYLALALLPQSATRRGDEARARCA